MLGDLLNAQSLAEPLRDALGHLAQLSEQRDEHVAALEAVCGALAVRLDAVNAQAAQREALLLSRIEALEEARRVDEAVRPREDFSWALRARLVQPGTAPTRLDDFVVVDLPTTPFGAQLDELHRKDYESVQTIVSIPTVFAIQRTPLLWSQWARVMGEVSGRAGNEPVRDVMVWSMLELCNKLSELDGLEPCYQLQYSPDDRPLIVKFKGVGASGYRLPLEVEWEAAARAGETSPHYGDPDRIAWHAHNSDKQFKPAGQLQPNALGLYDVLGNVHEVVWGDLDPGVDLLASKSLYNQRNNGLVSRGGSRLYAPTACRLGARWPCKLDTRIIDRGVRLVRTLQVREVTL